MVMQCGIHQGREIAMKDRKTKELANEKELKDHAKRTWETVENERVNYETWREIERPS